MKRQSAGYGAKIATTAIIWGFATGMMAICIPIIRMTKSSVALPITVVLGTTVSTVAVWLSGGQQTQKIDELINKCRVIEERLTDLETICNTQEFESRKKFEELEPKDRHRS